MRTTSRHPALQSARRNLIQLRGRSADAVEITPFLAGTLKASRNRAHCQ